MTQQYKNPPTVVVVLVPIRSSDIPTGRGLLLVRRNIPPGVGELAIPGGYQNEGETWQDTGIREVKEETGLDVSGLHLLDLVTVDGGRCNLAFAQANEVEIDAGHVFRGDTETSEVVVVGERCDSCFPEHTRKIEAFFLREGYRTP